MGPRARPRGRLTTVRRAALLVAALAASCGGEPASAEVRVFAAASLTDVMKTIAAEFEHETGTNVTLNLASSSVLAKQIVEGARCDLFLSADAEWAAHVANAGFEEPGTRAEIVGNSLVAVMRERAYLGPGSEPAADPLGQLLRGTRGRIAIGDPAHVPAGWYAKAALGELGLWETIEKRLVPCENVRAALALAERGETDLAIVYTTDARASQSIEHVVSFPEVPGVRIRYPALRVKGLSSRGEEFLRHLQGESARRSFRAAGFRVPPWTQ